MPNRHDEVGLTQTATLVVWLGCLAVGLVRIEQVKPAAPAAATRIMQAELLHVAIGDARAEEPQQITAPSIAVTPLLPAMGKLPEAAPFLQPAQLPSPAAPHVQVLVYGQGEGNKPQPEYPIEAQLDGLEGTVVVQFDVAADGHVESAAVVTSCEWPLLNRAAARSIQNTWRFSPGEPRRYLVSIVYRMKPH